MSASCAAPTQTSRRTFQTRELLDTLRERSDDVNVNEVLPMGRALKSFRSHYPRRPGLPDGPCPGPSYSTSVAAPTVFTVDYRGDVSICWNLNIGNARQQSLGQIMRGYDPAREEVVSTLLQGGPAALLQLPQSAGFVPKPAYANGCELCREVRHYLAADGRRA